MKKKIPYRIQYSLKSCKHYITATADIVPTCGDWRGEHFQMEQIIVLLSSCHNKFTVHRVKRTTGLCPTR